MITTKLESMLFGGWARVQTPLQIEPGVFKPLDTASLLISEQEITIGLRLYKDNPNVPFTSPRIFEQIHSGKSVVRELTLAELDEKARSDVANFLQTNFKYTAFVRYVYVWRESFGMDVGLFRRAVLGTEKLGQSFAGMLGSRNGSALIKSGQKWEILNESKLYPEIKKMPMTGIENIRAVARARKQKETHDSTLTG